MSTDWQELPPGTPGVPLGGWVKWREDEADVVYRVPPGWMINSAGRGVGGVFETYEEARVFIDAKPPKLKLN